MKFAVAFILFLFVHLTFGQKFHFKSYSLPEGLPRSGVYHIHQDQSGFLWIGTEGGGVCKFDGNRFHAFNRQNGLASEMVRTIFEDEQGVLWFGTTEGISYYDGQQFVSLTAEKDGISDNFIRSISQDQDKNIWVGTNRGISIIDPDEKGISGKLKVNFSLPDKKVRSLQSQGDIMWIGTDRGLVKYEKEEIHVFHQEDGLNADLILCLFVDSKNRLWIGTENGLNYWDGEQFQQWTIADGLISERVRSICEDAYGNLWIGTNQGLSIFDGKDFVNIDSDNGLTNNRIRCVQNDDFDNIWVGTYFGGILRFNHQDFISYTENDGLNSSQVYAINEDTLSNLLIGTNEGINRISFKNQKIEKLDEIQLPFISDNHQIHVIYKDKHGELWYGSEEGLFRQKGKNIELFGKEEGLLNESITTILRTDNTIWIGTQNGLGILTLDSIGNATNISFMANKEGLAGNEVSSIKCDQKGNVWIAFIDGSLTVHENGKFVNPILPDEVSEVISLAIDDLDNLWIGTNGNGIFHGQFNSKTHYLELDGISRLNGLSSNYIFSILIHQNRIWVGHEKGLDLINMTNDTIYTIHSYGTERGFLGLQNNHNAAFRDYKENLWFGTVNGLFCLNAADVSSFDEGKASIGFIQSIKVNGKMVNWEESEWCTDVSGVFNLPNNLILPYNQNNLSFDFIGLNFISPNKVKYQWKLEGFDYDWSSSTSKNYVSYTNLEAGNYQFKMKASDEHGVFSDNYVSFDFIIEKPFWDTWPFRILVLVLGLIVYLLTMRLRTRNLRKKKKELESIIRTRTAEIRSQKEELELQKVELTLKNTEITDSIFYSRRIQHSILPSNESIKNLFDDHFILYKPKDIVSGDFYWVTQAPKNPKKIHFAVADCTGHGVPGAMVSLVGTRALNSCVREHGLSEAHKILEKTNDIVLDAFTDSESDHLIKDGMDIALCSLNYTEGSTVEFDFSGAHNPVWIVRKATQDDLIVNGEKLTPNILLNDYKLFEIKGSKQPIGYFENRVPFVNHQCLLNIGDRIYMTSDGYADQFGGVKGKKFKYKTLKGLILNLQDHNLSDQKQELQKAFYDWKRNLEQVDDICIMGVQV